MDNIIGMLCKHTHMPELGVGVVLESYCPPFPPHLLHRSQKRKSAYLVFWLAHPERQTPPILSEYLESINGQKLSNLEKGQKLSEIRI